jgi:hypothetical protein
VKFFRKPLRVIGGRAFFLTKKLENEAMVRDIDALNEEMKAAGARIFLRAAGDRQARRDRCVHNATEG